MTEPLPSEGTEEVVAPAKLGVDSFQVFWKVYPRRVGKRNAQTAFKNALKRDDAECIIAGATAYRDDPNRDADFTSHPATWLNGDRWLDEFTSVRSELPLFDLSERFEEEPEGITFAEWLRDHATEEEREKARVFGLREVVE
jgi:hypothetical protein